MYFSIKIDSTDPRAANIVNCNSLEDVNSFLEKRISFTQPRSCWMNYLDHDITQIEDTDMRHNKKVRYDIISALQKPDCTEIHILDNCFIYGSSPCKLNIKKIKYVGEKAENMFIDDYLPVKDLYRNFQVTPERVIYNDPATIVFWKDGTKTVVKCMEGDTYNPEVGLAMCVCKKLYGSKYHKFFRYYAQKKPVSEKTEKKEEASLDEIYDKIAEMAKDALKTDKSFLEKFANQLFGTKGESK